MPAGHLGRFVIMVQESFGTSPFARTCGDSNLLSNPKSPPTPGPPLDPSVSRSSVRHAASIDQGPAQTKYQGCSGDGITATESDLDLSVARPQRDVAFDCQNDLITQAEILLGNEDDRVPKVLGRTVVAVAGQYRVQAVARLESLRQLCGFAERNCDFLPRMRRYRGCHCARS